MNDEQRAINAWMDTAGFRSAANILTLHGPADYQIFLRNRLWDAFCAGMDAGKRIERAQIEKRIGDDDGS